VRKLNFISSGSKVLFPRLRGVGTFALTALTLGATGCTALPRPGKNSASDQTIAVSRAKLTDQTSVSAPRNAAEGAPLVVADHSQTSVVPASHSTAVIGPQGVSPIGDDSCQTFEGDAIQYCGNGTCVTGSECGVAMAPLAADPNEFIYDGGDNYSQVAIKKDWTAVGVEPTDTLAYYETAGGKVCVKPTNRVPIYAPRFGSVRQVRGTNLSQLTLGPQGVLAPVAPGKMEDAELAAGVVLPVAIKGQSKVDALDAFQLNSAGVRIDQILALKSMEAGRIPYVLVDLFRTGELVDEQLPGVERMLASALTWYSPESVAVEIDSQETVVMRDAKLPSEILVYETEDKCSLRICKAASHTIAHSGDKISFTIRFDNVGPHPIKNTVIIDSLSPRLEYIEGSSQSSVDTTFESAPNEVGSNILKWGISGELDAGEGGVISFDCLVR